MNNSSFIITLDFEKKIIENVEILLQLEISFEYDKISNEWYVKCLVPIPKNYPKTNVYLHLIKKQSELAKISLTIFFKKSLYPYNHIFKLEEIQNLNTDKIFNNIILINSFNVNIFGLKEKLDTDVFDYNFILPTESEKTFKGIGKKILFVLLDIIKQKINLLYDKTLIILEASGGTIRNEEDIIKIKKLISQDGMNIFKAECQINLQNNEKLINYYQDGIGFKKFNKNTNLMYYMFK